ncbi:DUF551 domain-containing protein [Hafnia alvei]|uniref:DUF551 domain-containing protein n=2 Tax=Hafnia alvei TaxID=569 RepID=UPI00165DD904|nr:DUF551 domain-containing protein [Hafnia alvei]
MTKLTTERLEEIAKLEITEFSNGMDIAKDAYQSVGSSEIVLMARQLLAYEQAAEHPAARITWDGSEFSVSNVSEDFLYGGTAVYLAPVLPKQPELVVLTDEQIDAVLDSKANMAYIISDKRERLRMFAGEIIRTAMISTAPAQPVSEPYKLNGWISVDSELPEEGARVLAFSDGTFVLMTEFTGGEFYDVVRNGGEFFETVTRCVTHWMPLPEAPARESE